MPRRLLSLLAVLAATVVVGCNTTPQAPALTDPKEILVQTVASLQKVTTATIKGTFGGSLNAEGMGNFDLSTVTLNVSLDVPGKKARVQFDAPTLLGTTADMIVADENVYLKVVGPLAGFVGADATGKYTKMPAGTGVVPEDATDPAAAIEEMRKGIDSLPKAPEKLPDERIGDQDSYHVRLALTSADLGEMSEGAEIGSMTFDIWSRKSDLRPARITFSVDAGAQGTVTGTFEFTYDQGVNITAPPADQVAG